MSEQKFTPGPWICLRSTSNPTFWSVDVLDEKGYYKTTIVNVCHGGYEEANARLIAAAPDLLEALKQMREFVDQHVTAFDADPLIEAADNAIAKATP